MSEETTVLLQQGFSSLHGVTVWVTLFSGQQEEKLLKILRKLRDTMKNERFRVIRHTTTVLEDTE